MKAIRIYEYGGPEVLQLEELPTPEPGPGQALVEVAAVGVNFVDIYNRMGWYKLPLLPSGIGGEGAGRVAAIAPDVTDVKPGDRVAWLGGSNAYATHMVIAASKLAPVPGRRKRRASCRGHGAGRNGSRSDDPHLSSQGGRLGAGPCGGRRCRPAALPDGPPARRTRHRHRLQ